MSLRLVTGDPTKPSEADWEYARQQFIAWADADKAEFEREVSAPFPGSTSATPVGVPTGAVGPQLSSETDQVSQVGLRLMQPLREA